MENGKVKTTEKKPSFSQKFSLFYNKNILPKLEPIEQDRKKMPVFVCFNSCKRFVFCFNNY